MNKTNLEKKITFRYTVALLIIAILSTLSFYVLYQSLKESRSTAYIVNIAGKQRMLSQHIALNVHRIYADEQVNTSPLYHKVILVRNLLAYAKEMKEINEILSTGILSNGDKIVLSTEIYNLYYGKLKLKERIDKYTEIASELQKLENHKDINIIINKVDTQSEQLLFDLEKVVKQYELEGVQKLKKLEILEIVTWILTLLTLLLEVIFIFQPTVKNVSSLLQENENILHNLETEVELRTLKLQEANRSLKELASHDPMTGLRNRLTLEDDIDKAIEHFRAYRAPFAILMFDIDLFKDVNDEYGHAVGDYVIKEVANILQKSVREEDKVYRAGGEEFVILLSRISLEDTEKIAEKIRILMERKVYKADDIEFHKTISAGLYHSSITDAKSIFQILKIVDNALYEAKESGRNRVVTV